MTGFNMKVTPEIENLTELCKENTSIDLSLYGKYDVKRGLRDINGKGVLAGLTQVSNVQAVKVVDGKAVPCAGSLYYRGYNIKDLTAGFVKDNRFGFEETSHCFCSRCSGRCLHRADPCKRACQGSPVRYYYDDCSVDHQSPDCRNF